MKPALLTFALLLIICQRSFGQTLTAEQAAFISTHFVNLKADENYINADWEPVLSAIENKRLVLIGEFNHGSKEIFTSRNELIQQLHQKLGFDLILFESGLGELEAVNLKMKELNPFELTQGFFGPWRTQEFGQLMKYIQQNDIQISGFDVQRTGSTFTNYLSDKTDSDEFKEIEKEFIALKSHLTNYRTVYDSISTTTFQLIERYEEIGNNLSFHDNFSKRAIANRVNYLTYMLDFIKTKDWNKRWEERDRAMAENIKWILNNQEPNQKAIVIAHNFHVSKYNEKENVMGEFLKEDYKSEMFTIGVFAGKGAFANNSGQAEPLSPPSVSGLDIKHIIAADQGRLTFLNINQDLDKTAPWLQDPLIVNDTFIDLSSSNEMFLSRCFDGVLLLDEITPAEKR
ncbi:MAG: erythromycin esterase family protein [Phaeodactylibacter sp.]|nr:erythromycin esterase family protein [Phaeodactylibacter sp.]